MFLGRYQLGEEVVVPLLCCGPAEAPAAPDAAPSAMAYQAGAKVLTALLSPRDAFAQPALFALRLFLDSRFAVGQAAVALCYRLAGAGYLKTVTFEVVDGGDPAGAVVSMYLMERPQARYLVQRTDGGARKFGRNPSV